MTQFILMIVKKCSLKRKKHHFNLSKILYHFSCFCDIIIFPYTTFMYIFSFLHWILHCSMVSLYLLHIYGSNNTYYHSLEDIRNAIKMY